MVVTDLKTEPGKRSSKRHHPMHSVVKGADNLYAVHTPAHPLTDKATLNDIRLRVNALELNQSVLEREVAVLQERGSPFDGTVVPTAMLEKAKRVSPKRMTGPTHVVDSEQSKVDQGPTPVPPAMVDGSTALALPAPTDDGTKAGDAEPQHIKPSNPHLTVVRKAANDDGDVLPAETVAKLKEISDVDPQELADMAFQYGMDIVEASEILSREYSRREVHAYKTHGISRTDVQLARLLKQKGIVYGAYHKSEDSAFAGWFSETKALAPMLESRSKVTRQRDQMRAKIFGAMGYRTTGLIPQGEQNARLRLVERLKATMRKPKGTYQKNDTIAATLKGVGDPGVTTNSQARMIGSFLHEVGDRLRRTKIARAIGLGPKLRTVKQREQFEAEFDGSEVQFSQEFPLLYRERTRQSMARSLRLKRLTTMRILRPAKAQSERLDKVEIKQRMDTINRECLRRGIHTPMDMTIYQAMVDKAKILMGDEDSKVAVTK